MTRCEDYPCCGHTDGLGCETTLEMTADYWLAHPERLRKHEEDMDERLSGVWER